MTQKDIELILLRQWASHLVMPVWIADPEGDLVFYNEPAELLLQRRFDEAGEMPLAELPKIFHIATPDGTPVDADQLPLAIALRRRQPAHARLRIEVAGNQHMIDVTAIPLIVQGGRYLGAVVFFWEVTA
jgi:PAS domain-containing protein